MRKLLSLIALSCAIAMAFGAYAPGARAAALTTGVLALKVEQPAAVQKAYYYYGHQRWHHHGYRWRRHHGWRHHYGWRHRYGYHGWRHRHYGWHHRYWRNTWRYHAWRDQTEDQTSYQDWRDRFYQEHGYYPFRRHYYYNSYSTYTQPTYRRRHAPGDGFCIGLCWW